MRLRQTLIIAGLCVLSVSFAALDAAGAYTLSRGRRILLDRGLQIQPLVFFGQPGVPNIDVDRFLTANFTGINLWEAQEATPSLLGLMPAGTSWSRQYVDFLGPSTYLYPAELPYVGNLVSLQYLDEVQNLTDPNRLSEMATAYRYWNTHYSDTLAYTNFGGGDGGIGLIGGSDLTNYMHVTQPDMLSFDVYPNRYTFDRASMTRWYHYMQQYRAVALAGYTVSPGVNSGPLPYAQYLSFSRVSPTAELPSESFVRLQQNASWAFGYTYAIGFVYNSYNGSDVSSVMFSGMGDGSPTPVFDYVKETNRQSRNLGPALVRLVSTDIRMVPGRVDLQTNDLPEGVSSWASGNRNTGGYTDYITSITQRGKNNTWNPWNCSDVLVGYFNPLLDNNNNATFVDGLTFLIVNGAAGTSFAVDNPAGDPASASAEWFRVDFDFGDSGYNSLVRLSRDTGMVELVTLQHRSGGSGALYRLDLQLDGGTGDLFAFWNSSNPLPTIPEPSAMILLSTGMLGLLAYAWRKGR